METINYSFSYSNNTVMEIIYHPSWFLSVTPLQLIQIELLLVLVNLLYSIVQTSECLMVPPTRVFSLWCVGSRAIQVPQQIPLGCQGRSGIYTSLVWGASTKVNVIFAAAVSFYLLYILYAGSWGKCWAMTGFLPGCAEYGMQVLSCYFHCFRWKVKNCSTLYKS